MYDVIKFYKIYYLRCSKHVQHGGLKLLIQQLKLTAMQLGHVNSVCRLPCRRGRLSFPFYHRECSQSIAQWLFHL